MSFIPKFFIEPITIDHYEPIKRRECLFDYFGVLRTVIPNQKDILLLKIPKFRSQIELAGESSVTMKDLGTFVQSLPALLSDDRLSSFQFSDNIRNRLNKED